MTELGRELLSSCLPIKVSVINLIAYEASIGGVSSHTTVLYQS
jgi:hypothetical protein